MKTRKPNIIRKYKRQSRSPFEGDDSTILFLATIADVELLSIKYDRYIYLHRDDVGRWLGISLSNQLLSELNDGKGKYRSDLEMFEVLFRFRAEIAVFLRNFSDEIESVFGIGANGLLNACKPIWLSKLKDAGMIGDW